MSVGAPLPVTWSERFTKFFFSSSDEVNKAWMERMKTYRRYLDETGLARCCVEFLEPREAPLEHIKWVHDEEFVEMLLEADKLPSAVVIDYGDTRAYPGFLKDLLLIIGGEEILLDHLVERGRVAGYQPFGGLHHAASRRASGFCPANDIAVLIEYARRKYGWNRFAVIDIDVHHGDGTQSIYWNDPTVLAISFHGYSPGFYPGTGNYNELGGDRAKGTKLNVPLPPGTGDKAFLTVFERLVPEALRIYRPRLIVAQLGVDGHRDDPLGILMLTTTSYVQATKMLREVAEEIGAVLVGVGGGGYGVSASRAMIAETVGLIGGLDKLPPDVRVRVEELMDPEPTSDPPQRVQSLVELADLLLQKLEEAVAPEEEEEEN
ncbi:histone deacetylase superfamily [Pyrolobus fumarii 1A]|uniref:Histone deacetylase superfamily n=1 Tax=Pyrolobus fumarii (strain DSM 11204 / 1A) TaxID=694429 RepID=G0EEP2_PYRF1|nr:histone deacetylase [Pyrolobus fumarii]AEM38864.1 histone deacetylase superfamily [Pyrolobus fumarii 1A]